MLRPCRLRSLAFPLDEQKANAYHFPMDEGRKRVLAIVAGILVARHLKTAEDYSTISLVRARSPWSPLRCNGPSALCGRLTTCSPILAAKDVGAEALTAKIFAKLLFEDSMLKG